MTLPVCGSHLGASSTHGMKPCTLRCVAPAAVPEWGRPGFPNPKPLPRFTYAAVGAAGKTALRIQVYASSIVTMMRGVGPVLLCWKRPICEQLRLR